MQTTFTRSPMNGPQEMPEATPQLYAGWGRRFGAWLVDVCLLIGVIIVLSVIIVVALSDPDEQEAATYLLGFAVLVSWPLYFALCHSRASGQTVGKRLADIAVRNEETGGRLSFGRALGRAYLMWILYSLFTIPFIVDVLWPLWDAKRQALHDKVAGSVVLRTVS